MNNEFRINQFLGFYDLLIKNAPRGYNPWFFPCEKLGKNPCANAILKINSSSKGSWSHESARLSKEQCIEHIKQGYNLGISAREGDPLIIGDVDKVEYLSQVPDKTLITISRKRAGRHFFGWDKDGTAKINLPTDSGEIRSNNQYVLSPGSYVPFNLENEKEKKTFEELPETAKQDSLLGYYTLGSEFSPRELVFNDFPDFFKEQKLKDIEANAKAINNNEKKEFSGKGKYSELFNLKVSDIVGALPENKRVGHPLHESDTDANFSLSKDGTICHCWRHLVSLNPVQFLCVKAGYSQCQDAGTPHKERGVSKIKGDKKAWDIAYEEAVKMGLIKKQEENKDKQFLIWVEKFNSYIVNIEAVADNFCNEETFITVKGKSKDYLKRWNGKIWVDDARSFIKEKCELILGKHAKINPINEIIAKIERRKYISAEEFEEDNINLIPFENGVFNRETKQLQDYTPDNYFKTIIPIKYDANAQCPVWLKFLGETLYPEDIPVSQEWFGFNFLRIYLIKKALISLGERDTGKTVFLDVLTGFIGEQNKTGLSLQKLSSGNDFAKLSLKDKYSNIYDDLSSKDMNDGGNFKIATGGGYISAEEKFGDYKQFKNYAKHTFATNKIPPVKDNDDMAYYSRWIVLRFHNVPDKKDLFLKEKILNEKSGILNWALEGLFRLLEQGEFSYNRSPEEVKKIMEMSGDPLIQFGDAVLEQSEKQVTKEEMYEVYCLWANETDKPLLSKEQLGRRLNQKIKYLVAKTGAKERFWDNVALKPEWMEKLKNKPKVERLDTLDTFKKNMRKCPEVKNNTTISATSGGIDILFSEVSNPSKKEVSEEPQPQTPKDDFSEELNWEKEQ